MKVLRGKSPKMPEAYSQKLTELVARMLSFESEKRPTVGNILQQRFIRDRIKVFLQKQRPNSGKAKSRPKSGGKKEKLKNSQSPIPPQISPEPELLTDTMVPQIGTLKQVPKKRIEQVDKKDQLDRFLSDAAITMVEGLGDKGFVKKSAGLLGAYKNTRTLFLGSPIFC